MLGLSGVKIYETYTIDTTLLPKAYKDKIQFICSGVSHKVSDGEWTTTLNSICGPKYDNVKISNPPGVKNIIAVTVPKSPDQIGGGKTPYTDAEIAEKTKNFSVVGLGSDGTWQDIVTKYVTKNEGLTAVGKDDQGTPRAGFGSDKIIKNGVLTTVTIGMTVTRAEAENTFKNYSIKAYSDPVIKDLGQTNWNKLNNNQKAALVSVGYNVGAHYISARDYGQKIKKLIEAGNFQQAGETIYREGPWTGAVDGYLPGLQRRRKEESIIFLTP
jgi:GH24 family phage-related lysozyme (muramidase)